MVCLDRGLRRFSQMGYDAPRPFVPGFWMDVPSAEAPAPVSGYGAGPARMTVGVCGIGGCARIAAPHVLDCQPTTSSSRTSRLRHATINLSTPSANLTKTNLITHLKPQPMPIIETQLNGRIATLLDRMNARWSAYGETHGAFEGNQRQPDILVHQQGGRPVIIENEYLPAHTVEPEAISRLGENLDTDIVDTSGKINAVVALRSPLDLHNCRSHDQVDNLLSGGIQLEYALYTGTSHDKYNRFPQQGFIPGNLKDLAAFISYAAVPEDAIQTAIDTLIRGIGASATILREACEVSESTKEAITDILKQDYSDQTLRMTATIMINALVYQLSLSGRPGIPNYNDAMYLGSPIAPEFLRQWYKILEVNYWSIFKIAVDLLHGIASITHANKALKVMLWTAERLHNSGVAQSQDLMGTVFQRLIADRKFLATFYTRPESAALLAHLAIPDDGNWDDPERVKNFRVADYACGTGTLIHAAYRRINQLHLLSGGQPETLHAHMMQEALTACDVLPSSVHLTASMLSSSHPTEKYDGTRTIVARYGKTEDGGISIGSLDLLASNGEVRPLIALHSGSAVTATGEQSAAATVEMPQFSQDLVIMNPPFTSGGSDYTPGNPAGYNKKQFHGLGTDWDTQESMFNLARRYARGTCAHGYAGIASWFVALADRMAKNDGSIALVLPMTALQGSSWQKVRQLIASDYSDVIVITIATARQEAQSFSADTGMAETLLICRKSKRKANGRGVFVSLRRRPNNEMEAMVIARAISAIAAKPQLKRIEDGPFGGNVLLIGEERLGEAIDAPLATNLPWAAAGISDFSVVQSMYQLSMRTLWLPQMAEEDQLELPIEMMQRIGRVGITHNNIVGNGSQTAFARVKPPSSYPTYPMLWNHDAKLETKLIVAHDSEGRVKSGRSDRAAAIWATRSHTHHNADFRFNSQPLGVGFTSNMTIGGRAWPNIKLGTPSLETAHALWGNSTLGLMSYWWHSSRQQTGRGVMPTTSIRTMPTLDVTQLSEDQLQTAETIFDELRHLDFLPANEAYRDDTRKLLDRPRPHRPPKPPRIHPRTPRPPTPQMVLGT